MNVRAIDLLRREVLETDVIPMGYGMAYRKTTSFVYVFYPFPLNHLVAWVRMLWLWCRHAPYAKLDEIRHDEFETGRRAGYEAGFEAGKARGKEELIARIDAEIERRKVQRN